MLRAHHLLIVHHGERRPRGLVLAVRLSHVPLDLQHAKFRNLRVVRDRVAPVRFARRSPHHRALRQSVPFERVRQVFLRRESRRRRRRRRQSSRLRPVLPRARLASRVADAPRSTASTSSAPPRTPSAPRRRAAGRSGLRPARSASPWPSCSARRRRPGAAPVVARRASPSTRRPARASAPRRAARAPRARRRAFARASRRARAPSRARARACAADARAVAE